MSDFVKRVSRLLDFSKFKRSDKKPSAGKTGSYAAVYSPKDDLNDPDPLSSKVFQVKPSIKKKSWIRRLKVWFDDRENYGEVIASTILRSFMKNQERNDYEPIPEVFLTTEAGVIASKYLSSELGHPAQNIYELTGTLDQQNKCIVSFIEPQKVPNNVPPLSDPAKQGQLPTNVLDLSDPTKEQLRKDIAYMVVGAAIIGNHDINPGNVIITTHQGEQRISSIDAGHAFNDLIRFGSSFGGGITNKNCIIDFINRETVAKFPKPGKPKLWLNYVGIIPSKEIIEALRDLGNKTTELEEGITQAKTEFITLSETLKPKERKHLLASITSMVEAFGGKPPSIKKVDFSNPSAVNKAIVECLNCLKKCCEKNLKDAQNAADLMQLQLDINDYIKNSNIEDTAKVQEFKKKYNEIKSKLQPAKFSWLKQEAKEKPLSCDVDGYIAYHLKKKNKIMSPPPINIGIIKRGSDASTNLSSLTQSQATGTQKTLIYQAIKQPEERQDLKRPKEIPIAPTVPNEHNTPSRR